MTTARTVRAVAFVVGLTLLASLAAVGASALDERFEARRFTTADTTDRCPIAGWRDQAIPMCVALPGW